MVHHLSNYECLIIKFSLWSNLFFFKRLWINLLNNTFWFYQVSLLICSVKLNMHLFLRIFSGIQYWGLKLPITIFRLSNYKITRHQRRSKKKTNKHDWDFYFKLVSFFSIKVIGKGWWYQWLNNWFCINNCHLSMPKIYF